MMDNSSDKILDSLVDILRRLYYVDKVEKLLIKSEKTFQAIKDSDNFDEAKLLSKEMIREIKALEK